MTGEELIKEISLTIGKTKVDKLGKILKEQNFALRDLIDLTFNPDRAIAFRSSWLLENVFLLQPLFYLPDTGHLLTRFPDVVYPSCQRHYAKIMMHITSNKAPDEIQKIIAAADMEPVVEKCFDCMINPKVLIAVKVFSSEALFNLRHRYPWIALELAGQLEFLMQNGTSAIQTRGKKLLSRLKGG